MKLGMVTYQLGQAWDVPTILSNCKETGFEQVELRSTHAHGVAIGMAEAKWREVKQRFADSGIGLWGLGTTCEYHAADAATVRRNVEETKQWIELAAHLGARGVKVRPNGLQKDVEPAKVAAQVGAALSECGKAAGDAGVLIYVEVHGPGSSNPAFIKQVMDACPERTVGVCWNSNLNGDEVKNGSIAAGFAPLAQRVLSCHINELFNPYPWRELFSLMKAAGYDGATLAEIPASLEPVRLMRYYRALWLAQQPA